MTTNHLSSFYHQQNLPDGTIFDLVLIESGCFKFGKQNHEIALKPFYLGRYPVTQQLWYSVIGESPKDRNKMNYPIDKISWYDCAAFCNALNEICGYPNKYYLDQLQTEPITYTITKYLESEDPLNIYPAPSSPGYRLPSETEWEYAARGGKHSSLRPDYVYPGGNKLDVLCWHPNNNHNETKPVGLKFPNELKLFDMGGNVAEWCEDQYTGTLNQIPTDGSAWKIDMEGISILTSDNDNHEDGNESERNEKRNEDYRIVRGGGANCKSKSRSRLKATLRLNFQGFRLAFSPIEEFKINP